MATPDVTVMGAGIFGLSVAWACARRGARVRVVDPRGPGGGGSGGIVGALAPHVPENWNDKKAFQLESLLMAATFWAEVSEHSGMSPGYARTGRVQPLGDARAVARARERGAGAAALWRGRAAWQLCASDAVPGWVVTGGSGLVVHDTLSARLHPRQACAALAAALRARGGEIVTEAGNAAPGGAVVWATGYEGLAVLSEACGRPVGAGVKGQALLLRLPARDPSDWPQLLIDGLHLVPHADGTVALGSTSEPSYDRPDSVDAAADALLGRARAALPDLDGAEVVERWAGVRPRARSRSPILDAWPGRDGHFIANGGFKIGFGMAPLAGAVLADLVLEGRDAIPSGFRLAAST